MIQAMSRVVVLFVLLSLVWVRPALAEDPAAPVAPAPSGIAVDAEGDVYVTDYALDRVVKFGADGSVLTQWGGSGSAQGQFNAPFGVAVDSTDTVFVVDQLNNRLQRFATDGTVLGAWGGPGAGAGELRTPFGVAVGGGHVYVADFGNDRVDVFSTDGSPVLSFGRRGSGDGQFQRPAGIALAPDGGVYVLEMSSYMLERIATLRFDARSRIEICDTGRPVSSLRSITYATRLPSGEIAAPVTARNR